MMALHNHGTALIFARTDTRMFHKYVFGCATAILFIAGRITFLNSDGSKPSNTGGAPSCLVAYGEYDAAHLIVSGIKGFCVRLKG